MHVDSDAHVVTSLISTSVGLPQSLRGADRVSVNLHVCVCRDECVCIYMSVCVCIESRKKKNASYGLTPANYKCHLKRIVRNWQ
jgi:hypothetical protein